VQKPILIYDGNCGFCKRWTERVRRKTGEKITFAPYQEAAQQFPRIPREEFERAVQLIFPDGIVKSGAEAIFAALALTSFFWKVIAWKYTYIPGFAAVSEWVYRHVAKRRSISCSLHVHD
jgi:lipase maturation factor 1